MCEANNICDNLCKCMTNLVHHVSSLAHVLLAPWLSLYGCDWRTDLSNQAKCVSLNVCKDSSTVCSLVAEVPHVPECLSEVAVLIILERKINNIVGRGHWFLICDRKRSVNKIPTEINKFVTRVWNPLAKTVIRWFYSFHWHAVEARVHASPDAFSIEINCINLCPSAINYLCILCFFRCFFSCYCRLFSLKLGLQSGSLLLLSSLLGSCFCCLNSSSLFRSYNFFRNCIDINVFNGWRRN